MTSIIVNEWRGLLRSRVFLVLSVVFSICLALSTWFGIEQTTAQREAQAEAKAHVRAQWDEMEPSNPHRAAHFGSYAFKPINALNSIDEGVNTVTGNVLRLEGHKQTMLSSEAAQSLLISKFVARLCFNDHPADVIFVINAYMSERESGRHSWDSGQDYQPSSCRRC